MQIWERLDRLLINNSCYNAGFGVSVTHLARDPSDHSPLLLLFTTRLDDKPRPFRFLNAWAIHPGFLEVVRKSWQQECVGAPIQVLCSKVKRLKADIKVWNVQCFGNIFNNVKRAEKEVVLAKKQVEDDISVSAQESLRRAQAKFRQSLIVEECFWKQKARVRWLDLGDKNAKFFHSVVKQKRLQSVIHRVQDEGGNWLSSEADIGQEAVKFFSSLFSAEATSSWDLSSIIPNLIQPADNAKLEEIPTMEDVRWVVSDMDSGSAAGPDGYTGKFFTFASDIVAQDLYNAVVSFFCGAELPKKVIATLLLLIPKVKNPKDFSHFHPISLCNFINKVFSCLLADRLSQLLPKIISPNQSGFVCGRLISDNFLFAQEIIMSIGKKNMGGNVALKLDMTKAYDRVSWIFLINVLRAFGFGERCIDMV